jgi:hypothetical protein
MGVKSDHLISLFRRAMFLQSKRNVKLEIKLFRSQSEFIDNLEDDAKHNFALDELNKEFEAVLRSIDDYKLETEVLANYYLALKLSDGIDAINYNEKFFCGDGGVVCYFSVKSEINNHLIEFKDKLEEYIAFFVKDSFN